MKDFFEKLMSDDETCRKFTRFEVVVYGVLMPMGLVAAMCVAGWIENVCK